jgi:hypothetical protein
MRTQEALLACHVKAGNVLQVRRGVTRRYRYTGPGDVDHLLPEYEKLLARIAATRAELKAQLQEALTR